MAINIKTLATRTASAIVFVIILLSSVTWSYLSFSIFFFFVALMALNEFYAMAKKLNAKPYSLMGFLFGSLLYFSCLNFNMLIPSGPIPNNDGVFRILFSFIVATFFITIIIPIFSKNDRAIKDLGFTFFGIFYTIIPFVTLNLLARTNGFNMASVNKFNPKLILAIIFLIWSNDTFAYLGGSLFGKHKMIERISPGKTWEGTLIGLLLTLVTSYFIDKFMFENSSQFLPWPFLGIAIPILATLGDLIESMIKRQAGVKDSGKIMPGHGGMLDRFDSLILVAPLIYVLLNLISLFVVFD